MSSDDDFEDRSFTPFDKSSGTDYFAPYESAPQHGSLEEYLANINMSRCLSILCDNGFTSLELLSFATIGDLERIGLLKGHAIMIVRAMDLNLGALEALQRMGISHGNALMMLRAIKHLPSQTSSGILPYSHSDLYKPQVWGVNFWGEAEKVLAWKNNPNGVKPRYLLPGVLTKFAPAGSYMMALALNRMHLQRRNHDEKVKEKIRQLRIFPEDLGSRCSMWKKRYQKFVERGTPENFRDFVLFLSKMCAQQWIVKDANGNSVSAVQVQPGLSRGNGDHIYLPDNNLARIFKSITSKHTTDGIEQLPLRDRHRDDRVQTAVFLDQLVGDHERERDRERLFYKLFKDAVIATLHSGTTVLEQNTVRRGGQNYDVYWEIVAKFDKDVGWPDRRNKNVRSSLYRVRFERLLEQRGRDTVVCPVFRGMWPVDKNFCQTHRHEPVEHLAFDHDQAEWNKTYFPDQRGWSDDKKQQFANQKQRDEDRDVRCGHCKIDHD